MWKKTLLVIFLFLIFTLLQNSFLTHYNLFGANPNLVFILYFVLIFTHKNEEIYFKNSYYIVLLSLLAGFLLDVYSYTYIGPSIIAFIVIGLLLKKIQTMLKNQNDECPFVYFLPLFALFFGIYNIFIELYLQFLISHNIIFIFNWNLLISVVYNLVVASVFLCVYKKWQKHIK